jgi:hypothetical protein
MIVASVFILFHLSSVVVRVLATSSGPWASMDGGATPAMPPRFAWVAYQSLPGSYLKLLQMQYDYHFDTDRMSRTGIYVEARLKDKDGKEIARVKLPDENSNSWVRHRQQLLVEKLGGDEAVPVPMTERVPAPGQPEQMVTIWSEPERAQKGRSEMRLQTVALNSLVRRGRQTPVFRPSDLSMVYARAIARELCRTHDAASAEIVRVFQNPVPPDVLFDPNATDEMFEPISSSFGELPR